MSVIKVKNTEKFSDLSGTHNIARGTLILSKVNKNNVPNSLYVNGFYRLPYILSKNEQQGDLIKGDKILFHKNDDSIEICEYVECDGYGMGVIDSNNERATISYSQTSKILAFPENLSGQQQMYIVDGKLSHGDEVLVKCSSPHFGDYHGDKYNGDDYFVDLKYNFVQLIRKLETSWIEIWQEWISHEVKGKNRTDVTFSLWLQDKYNVPTKK